MKIGLDLHGVVTDIPETFKFLAKAIYNAGGEVHIITGGSFEKAAKELEDLKFSHVTHIFSVLDYHIGIKTPITGYNEKYKNPEFKEETWDKTKAEYCLREKIDLMIDDSLIYNEYFQTPFARLFTHTNTPKKNKPHRHLS